MTQEISSLNKVFDINNDNFEYDSSIRTTGSLVVVDDDDDESSCDSKLNEKLIADLDNSRSNLYNLISVGSSVLENAMQVAIASEAPRSYEVFTTLLKTLSDMNVQLIDLQQKRKSLISDSDGTTTTITTNNNSIFVGSTNELQKMINSMTTRGSE